MASSAPNGSINSISVPYKHKIHRTIDRVIVPPKVTQELLDVFPKLPYRPGDVLINTYPKSGTTWANEILWQIYDDGTINETTDKYMSKVEYLLHDCNKSIDELVDIVKNNPCRIFKSHLQAQFFPAGKDAPKYVIVLRNPKDNAVSYFHFYHSLKEMEYSGPWEEFFEMFMVGEVEYGSYFDHVLGWWQRRDETNVLILKYEDMKKDLSASVKKLAQFVGEKLSSDTIEKIAEQTTFKSMKRDAKEKQHGFTKHFHEGKQFFRKGEVGDWKNYFTEEQNRRMDAMIAEKLSGTGLVFDYE